ncbi:MAG: AgmX/PglI C-terminal domain-containing protein [Proteobacteria bacterium]|nr:AgmX/PglI C-terminal domain-containing protein [Pseudomonadota bacterium]MCP4917438.1 AgmX/PglI C-terminal domain-containing protein [Pseudomonadota bacterium]
MLLFTVATALASPCDSLLLNVEIAESGFKIQGADDILYPDGRIATADNPRLRCTVDTCAEVGDYHWAGLAQELATVKNKCPDADRVHIVPHAGTRHDVLLSTIDVANDRFPTAHLGGGAQGYPEEGSVPKAASVLVRPGQIQVGATAMTIGTNVGDPLKQALRTEGTITKDELTLEVADSVPFSDVREVMRAAGQVGYTTFHHSAPDAKKRVTTYAPGGGEWVIEEEPKPTLGELSQNEVLVGINKAAPGVLSCYNQALGRDATLSGQVVTRFTIDVDGTVAEVAVTEGMEDTLDACVAEAVKGATFPKPRGGQAIATFPFKLSPG